MKKSLAIGVSLLFFFHSPLWAAEKEHDSRDLYCETFALSVVDTQLSHRVPTKPEDIKEVDRIQDGLRRLCLSTPSYNPGEKPVPVKQLTTEDTIMLSCIAQAEGIGYASALMTDQPEKYTTLSRDRMFVMDACEKNSKKFLDDLSAHGFTYARKQIYRKQ